MGDKIILLNVQKAKQSKKKKSCKFKLNLLLPFLQQSCRHIVFITVYLSVSICLSDVCQCAGYLKNLSSNEQNYVEDRPWTKENVALRLIRVPKLNPRSGNINFFKSQKRMLFAILGILFDYITLNCCAKKAWILSVKLERWRMLF